MKQIKKMMLLLAGMVCGAGAVAQQPVYTLDFDGSNFKEPVTPEAEAVYKVDLQRSQFTKGISGYALDLSADAALRRPVKLMRNELPSFKENTSFSVQIWLRTKPGALMGTPVIGNKKADNPGTAGWQIYTQENGAWALIMNDGKNRYDYKPTVQRQGINDGRWHQLLFTVNRDRQELRMYLDGRNRAIYNIAGAGSFDSDLATVAGGSDEKWEYGSNAQWNAFNGHIDDIKMWDTAISPGEVQQLYTKYLPGEAEAPPTVPRQLKILSWNIWHGGHRYGQHVGLQRLIDVMKLANADVIGLIETYGSGEVIADSLGYYFYLISSNLSVMSRYPITTTISVGKPSNFGGVTLMLGPGKELIFLDTWLHYLPDVSESIIAKNKSPEALIAGEAATRQAEITAILQKIQPLTMNADKLPVVMVGDFNIGSHLDWIAATSAIHYNRMVEWPESKAMKNAGFIDSYRKLHVNPLLDPGLTWTPRAATSSFKYGLRDRIDFIYYKGLNLRPIASTVIDYHPVMFPSDHAAVMTVFELKE
ncbi:endonuclease/exonuclease/phosphatase family protein [Chitinophaga hostae]|uniref:Endonuclease/exonuclease/phosphatase family protein n=1 Tax=Chitinophaga hostae TaxID=2831022 RepID=A0ABS5J3L3_9BACT|nr:endonuclease/exonuclease/phosphatase family protein [Chitinophaga hostae]MBS0029745.1 endonuclease/exonuclease/phosphatase family protein [Chitinophaga hostae]